MEQYADQPYDQYHQYSERFGQTPLNPQFSYAERLGQIHVGLQPTYPNPIYTQPSYPGFAPAAHASPANNFTFTPYQTVNSAAPAIPKGYYRNKDGQIMKRKSSKAKSYYGQHQVWATEHEIKQIRANYDLIPLKCFALDSAAGTGVWVATQNGHQVHEYCKLVRVSNAEYAVLQELRRANGGLIPKARLRSVEEQREWDEANQRANERFVRIQKKAIDKAGGK